MSKIKTGCVKARSSSKMTRGKRKVQFTPSLLSARGMEKASQAGHIRSENNIMRFRNIDSL